ncbi:uncharacterized protein GGS25DRAFT_486047 [Hypoxylon fragiforme]|uniref:uncharacterized protein n=1 Tax=Hypoxylon fragiforme TaxID=63214 RepID=UPI0020C5ECFB|nr:uncharacterized protein GGS25DRAFT_486047 [Hypoxylon fragiforme]KAI2609743.1 hypothetical protein GGS25DRAFT_486047 [Hypoxylon fragiforme]
MASPSSRICSRSAHSLPEEHHTPHQAHKHGANNFYLPGSKDVYITKTKDGKLALARKKQQSDFLSLKSSGNNLNRFSENHQGATPGKSDLSSILGKSNSPTSPTIVQILSSPLRPPTLVPNNVLQVSVNPSTDLREPPAPILQSGMPQVYKVLGPNYTHTSAFIVPPPASIPLFTHQYQVPAVCRESKSPTYPMYRPISGFLTSHTPLRPVFSQSQGDGSFPNLKTPFQFSLDEVKRCEEHYSAIVMAKETTTERKNKEDKKKRQTKTRHDAGAKIQYNHVCLGCGKARSKGYEEAHPLKRGQIPVQDYCRKCLHRADMTETDTQTDANDCQTGGEVKKSSHLGSSFSTMVSSPATAKDSDETCRLQASLKKSEVRGPTASPSQEVKHDRSIRLPSFVKELSNQVNGLDPKHDALEADYELESPAETMHACRPNSCKQDSQENNARGQVNATSSRWRSRIPRPAPSKLPHNIAAEVSTRDTTPQSHKSRPQYGTHDQQTYGSRETPTIERAVRDRKLGQVARSDRRRVRRHRDNVIHDENAEPEGIESHMKMTEWNIQNDADPDLDWGLRQTSTDGTSVPFIGDNGMAGGEKTAERIEQEIKNRTEEELLSASKLFNETTTPWGNPSTTTFPTQSFATRTEVSIDSYSSYEGFQSTNHGAAYTLAESSGTNKSPQHMDKPVKMLDFFSRGSQKQKPLAHGPQMLYNSLGNQVAQRDRTQPTPSTPQHKNGIYSFSGNDLSSSSDLMSPEARLSTVAHSGHSMEYLSPDFMDDAKANVAGIRRRTRRPSRS